MLKKLNDHLRGLPKEAHDPIDLQNRAAILESKLLYTNMSTAEIEDTEKELAEIKEFLGLPDGRST